MTTAPPGAELEQGAHDRLGAIARVLMTGASIVHDAAAHYLSAHSKALTEQLAQMREETAALTFRAYYLGRFHELHRVALPPDCVAAAAQLDPSIIDDVVDVVRTLTAAYGPGPEVVTADHSAAAAPIGDEDQAAAELGELEHLDHETTAAPIGDEDQAAAELGELEHLDHETTAAAAE